MICPECNTELDSNKDLLEIPEEIQLESGEKYEFRKVLECPNCGFVFAFAMASFDEEFAQKIMDAASRLFDKNKGG